MTPKEIDEHLARLDELLQEEDMSASVPEPVRKYIYGVVIAVLGALVIWGVVDQQVQLALIGIAQAVLLVPAVELARGRVTPLPRQEPYPDRDQQAA